MTTVQNTVTDPGGEPLVAIAVRVTLMTGSPNVPGYAGSSDITGTLSIPTDAAGHWSANLTPNASITPANTWYQVVEGQAVSNIVVPASGGPYNLSSILVTPPSAGTPLGITGVQVAADGTIAGVRPEINLIGGTGVTVTAADNAGSNRVDVTLTASGGGGGAVSSVFTRTGAVVAQTGDYSFSQISGTAASTQLPAATTLAQGAVELTGDLGGTAASPQVTGTHLAAPLPLAQGGTGQATQQAALTALAGTQTAGRYLRSDGTNTALSAIAAADVPTLNQSTTGTAANVTGVVALANGGSGQATQQAAINALTGTQVAGGYLRSDGTNATLSAIQAGDVPTLNQSTTGTAANVTGTVALANGGTGQTSRQAAINALTGTQSAGTYLRSDGTNATLAAIQAGDVPTLNQNTTGTAAGLSATLAVGSGGTGATTAIAARANLGEYVWDTPAARGLLEYIYPPQLATVSNNLVSGSIYGSSFIAQGNSAVSRVGVGVLSSAATPTAGQNLIGLYSISGTTATQIAVTGDLGTWSSQGFQSYAFGAGVTLTAGATYLILLMSNASTPVHLAGLSTTAGFPPMYNAGLSNTAAPWFKVFLYGTAQTALPASFTISGSTMASTNSQFPWVCLL